MSHLRSHFVNGEVENCISKSMHLKSLIKSHILIPTFEMKSDKQANGIINISEAAIYQN